MEVYSMDISENDSLTFIVERAEIAVVQYLKTNDQVYQELQEELNEIIDNNHKLLFFFDQSNEIEISKNDHDILLHYLDVKTQMDEIVKTTLYLYGLADYAEYSKLINAIHDMRIK